MKITRPLDLATIQNIQQTGEVEIELTAEECREAYLEEQRTYHLSKAADQFKDYFHCEYGAFDNPEAEARFLQQFGITGIDVIDENSGHYLVEEFANTFERCHDCNNADNDTWRAVIIEVLQDYSSDIKHRCPHCGCQLPDSDVLTCPLCDENFFKVEAIEVDLEHGGTHNG